MGRARAQSSELHFTFQSRVTLAQRTQGIRFIYKILKSQLIIYTVPPHPAIIYTCTSLEKIKTFFKKEKNDYRVGVSMFYPLSASPAGMAFLECGGQRPLPGAGETPDTNAGPEALRGPCASRMAAREDVSAPRGTEESDQAEGRWEPRVLHTKHGDDRGGEGSAHLLAEMTLYIVDPWDWENRWQQSLWKQKPRWPGARVSS